MKLHEIVQNILSGKKISIEDMIELSKIVEEKLGNEFDPNKIIQTCQAGMVNQLVSHYINKILENPLEYNLSIMKLIYKDGEIIKYYVDECTRTES